MEAIGSFILDQLLKMQWLSEAVSVLLSRAGIDVASCWGASLHFFVYDSAKIALLLVTMIFVISYVQSYFPPERSQRILGRFSGVAGNLAGALLGTVTPFCSCSSIPIFIGFTRAGLPLGVTFSFLISSPMVDLGSLVLVMSVFGPAVAAAYTIVGLTIAVVGGGVIERLHMARYVEAFVFGDSAEQAETLSVTQRERLSYARGETAQTLKRVAPYILVGVGLGALIHNWIPAEFIEAVLGERNPFAVVLAVLAGAPIYADIFGTIPIAEALFAKGTGVGTVLAFMMSVTVLSLPSLTMLARVLKPRLLALFVGVCLVGMCASGYAFNAAQSLFGWT